MHSFSTRIRRLALVSLLSSLVLVAGGAISGARAQAPVFTLVCNGANAVSSISVAELRRLFTGGTKQWPSGAVVQVALIPAAVPPTAYLAQLLETTPSELIGRIQQQVFRGEMRRPVVLRSGADCIAFARATLGGVCVAEVVAANSAGVRAVPVH
jgi:hypothetical protein